MCAKRPTTPSHSYVEMYETAIKEWESVQKRAAHFIVSDHSRLSSISRIINSLNLKSIVYHHTRLRLLTFYKIVNHLVELPIPSYIVHATRASRGNQDKYIKPSATVDAYKFSFYPRSITLWNQLPIDDIFSLNDFDNILQSTLTHSITISWFKTLFLYSNFLSFTIINIYKCSYSILVYKIHSKIGSQSL